MTETRTRILWGIDSSSNGIASIPASPFLLPAAIIYFMLWIAGKIIRFGEPKREPIPDNFNATEYRENKIAYYKICEKIRKGEELTCEDYMTNNRIARPSWAKPGEWWIY
jgi:hypothetical protein